MPPSARMPRWTISPLTRYAASWASRDVPGRSHSQEDTAPEQVLEHLHLLNRGRPTHAAILLFGTVPQRFLISSEIKCAHFHGTEVHKPIPFYQVYKGTAFDLVDLAVDFVLSKIDLAVGTREHSTQAPVAYEMPPEVVREAIVNAVAHRDYTSNGSVQVMLFSDRLEVWNPGTLPPSLTLEKLRHPHGSVPGNPLLAEPLYLTKYIERMGTGTGDMIMRCRIRRAIAWCAGGMCSERVVCWARRKLRAWLATRSPSANTLTAVAVRNTSTRSCTQTIRHRVIVIVDGDVVVDVDARGQPLADGERLGWQWLQRRSFDRLEQRPPAALARRAERAVVPRLDQLGDRRVGLGA